MKIKKINAVEAFDSRGLPTLDCLLTLDNDLVFRAKVPSGASRGRYEAHELRDGGSRYAGLGLKRSIEAIETIIAPTLINRVPDAIQMDLDLINLDATPNKSRLGGNTTLAVSMCIYRAQSFLENLELFEFISYIIGSETVSLPIPIFNFINGGMHAQNNIDIQEYLVIPGGAQSFSEAMEKGFDFYQLLKKFLEKNNKKTFLGDEGGFASDFSSSREPLDYLMETKQYLNLRDDYFLLGVDIAASHFYDPASRLYQFEDDVKTTQQMIDWVKDLREAYNLYYIEDPLNQDDMASWIKLTTQLADETLIVGDDLFATNPDRLVNGIENFAANAVIIKPNQIGTVTEAIQTVKVAQDADLATIVSHRSGDTEDDFIADLAVGVSANFIKSGGLAHSERLAKYNRLLEIEHYLVNREE